MAVCRIYSRRRGRSGTCLVVLTAILIVGCLWYRELIHLKRPRVDVLFQGYSSPGVVAPNRSCSIPVFREHGGRTDRNISCHRIQPSQQSCERAEKYVNGQEPPKCGQHTELCSIKFGEKKHYLRCHNEACPFGGWSLGTFSSEEGDIIWTSFLTASMLEEHFQFLVDYKEASIGSGIAFVECRVYLENRTMSEDAESKTTCVPKKKGGLTGSELQSQQLLIFPNITKQIKNTFGGAYANLNINILLLDSVSHSHMFRTLPLSLQQLRIIDEDLSHGPSVFNFDRMQSLMPITHESLQVLLTGKILSTRHVLPVRAMFSTLKNRGYDILWHEDLCWHDYGLGKYFGTFNETSLPARWNKFLELLKSHSIDYFGASLTSCEVTHSNCAKDPFQKKVMCYNGRYHHWYILEYAKQMQSIYQRAGKPYFQYTELNIGHTKVGTTIKTLDKNLATYLRYLSTLENTLTLILSDHGNRYTEYAITDDEGFLEQYHPLLFILAPRNFADYVGSSGMENLAGNQDKLISFLDIHLMLRYLLDMSPIIDDPPYSDFDLKPRGLLDPVSSSRTCSSLPLFRGSECICDTVLNGTSTTQASGHVVLAELGLGFLNNKIQTQAHQETGDLSKGSCRKLIGVNISNVTETQKTSNIIEVKMRISTQQGRPFAKPDVFSFAFDISWDTQSVSVGWYGPVSVYGKYDKCRDERIDRLMCVCDARPAGQLDTHSAKDSFTKSIHEPIFNLTSSVKMISRCLTVRERRRKEGMILEGWNLCKSVTVEFEVSGVTNNVASSSMLPTMFRIPGGQSMFLVAFLVVGGAEDWSVSYEVNVH